MAKHVIEGEPGEKLLLLGNEAIARGALEAGISSATAYPGTPSTEIIESLAPVAEKYGVYVEWSANEKVALEFGIGASMMGLRALVAMKHVGVNVASDPLMSLGYAGAVGGLVVVTADDPNAFSSQNEQDNRIYGVHSYIPVFEPSNPQEAKDMARDLFDLSERYETAVFLRSTTRLSHTRGGVTLGPLPSERRKPSFHRDPARWALLPPYNLEKHKAAVERIEKLGEELHTLRYNRVEGDGEVAVATAGVAYNYVVEALEELGVEARIYKFASTFPLPRRLALDALSLGKVVVVEELEPVIEWQLRVLAQEEGIGVDIVGKRLFPRVGELNTRIVASGLARALGVEYEPPPLLEADAKLPPRPPTMCPGCGHRSTYYGVWLASKKLKAKPVYPNDIGCYTLGFFPPFQMADLTWSMGSSIGIGSGIARFSDEPVIAFVGDSTFFHAGMPGLVNAVYNSIPLVLVVMDNRITAMTGHQPHPGSGVGPLGEPRKEVKIEEVARALGVEHVAVVDAYDVRGVRDAVVDAVKYARETGKPAVVVSKRPCALLEARNARRRGVTLPVYVIDQEKCIKCGVCTDWFACPAIVKERGEYRILPELCVGCGVCAQICPVKAIHVRGGEA